MKVLKEGSGEGFSEFLKRGLLWVLQQKRVLRRVLTRGSERVVSRRHPERPLEEYDPLLIEIEMSRVA